MESLITTFGLDWKLLLSQAVNFFILLLVLRYTVYGPLVELMRKRQERIEEGLRKAKEADERIEAIGALERERAREAEARALQLLREAEARAEKERQKLLALARKKEQELMKEAEKRAEAERAAALLKVRGEAVQLVKRILIKAVGTAPHAVDDALIKKAAESADLAQ